MNSDCPHQVALVLDPNFGEKLISLGRLMPVWILDSPKNSHMVSRLRNNPDGTNPITSIPASAPENPKEICERIVQSLDDHYNEHSQSPGYHELMVIGVSLGDVSLKPFLDLSFINFTETADGFIARKVVA